MIYLKTDEEIELLRENNLLVSRTLAEVGRHIAPGVTTKQLDTLAEDFIRSHGAVPAFLGYEGYPASLCISVTTRWSMVFRHPRESSERETLFRWIAVRF